MYKYLLNQCYCILTIFFVMSYVYIIYIYIWYVRGWCVCVHACVCVCGRNFKRDIYIDFPLCTEHWHWQRKYSSCIKNNVENIQ